MHTLLSPDRVYVTVDILILTVRSGRLCLALSRRAEEPYRGMWALPGRFVGLTESAETTVRHLMDEMLPIDRVFMEQLYTFTDVNRDPRGRVISAAYLVIVPWKRLEGILTGSRLRLFEAGRRDGKTLLTGEGVSLTGGDLAFDHGRIIESGINRLQGKIDYTDIGFRFLNDPGAFSLGELQTVFEAVLARPMDSSNFRRFISTRYLDTGKVIPTDGGEKPRRGRPASLYALTE